MQQMTRKYQSLRDNITIFVNKVELEKLLRGVCHIVYVQYIMVYSLLCAR